MMLVLSLALVGSIADVRLEDLGSQVRLSNGIVSVTVDKATATIPDMRLKDSPNLAGRGGYFAVANSAGKDGWDIRNGTFAVIRQTPQLVEISTKAPVGGCVFDQRYVLRKGDPGYYVYVKMERPKELPPESFGQVRWSFYLSPELFDYQWSNDLQHGIIPDFTGSATVQDATYRLKNGTVYTKYDFCDYVDNHFVHGITGSKPGGYGAFVVMGSNEYLGAPTKQYITVHSGPIIHRFLNSGHFMPRGLAHPQLPDNWTKLCGPWFIYLNKGDAPLQMWVDAKKRADQERMAWPYSWMRDDQFPVKRSKVAGKLKFHEGGKAISGALIVLTNPRSEWQTQILDYIYSTRTDAAGRFELPHVRPGTYTLAAVVDGYPEELKLDSIEVKTGSARNLGELEFQPTPLGTQLWRIGDFDRTTKGFRLSDRPRHYELETQVPANLVYQVANSQPAKDWFYCQAKPGDWNIDFQVYGNLHGEATLTVGIAGQTHDPKLEVLLNGESMGSITTAGNSSAQYRSAILGSSYYEFKQIRIDGQRLKTGPNRLTLRLGKGAIHYDAIALHVNSK